MAERSKTGANEAGGPHPGRDAAGRFLPGVRGGPGRKEGSRNAATMALDKLLEGEAEAVLRATIATALAGDASAQRALLDCVMPVRKGARVRLALPEVTTANGVLRALGEVVAAMSRGEVSPDEAAVIAAVVAAPRAILEAQEVERRLAEIERRLQAAPPPHPEDGQDAP